MVTVDRLSIYAHFAALPTSFNALKVATLFIETVVKHHGFPKTLVSDRDSIFLSATWKDMLRLSGTQLHFSTAYHPQSDGQTEVRNRGLEQYLRAFAADRPSKWVSFLPWAELALNCFYHEGLGMTPFRALYGREPPSLVPAAPSQATSPTAAELIRDRGQLLVDLRRNLLRAQQRMRDTANRHRRDVNFNVGDKVLLKLQPYRQHSVARPQSAKLARRYYGPFEIVEKIGPVAYRLQLPIGCKIHNVFHVSLLRQFIENENGNEQVPLPPDFFGGRPVAKPTALLDRRTVMQGSRPLEQGLLQWSDEGPDSASWEPMETIRERFPSLLLEDKEALIGGGVDTNIADHDHDHTTVGDAPAAMLEEDEDESEWHKEKEIEAVAELQPERRSQRARRKPDRFADYVSR